MKLLHVIPSIDPAGGGPIEGIRQLRQPLRDRGAEIDVCCGDAPDAPCVRASEMNVIALGPTSTKYGLNLAMLAWLRAHAGDYDAVLVEGLWQFHALATCIALRGGKVPYFVYTHGMLDPWFRERYPLKHVKKSLYWLLGEYWVLRRAQGVLFTCEEEQRRSRNAFWPYRCRELVAGYGTAQPPTGAAPLREAFLAAFPDLRGKRIVLFLGRIHEKKGCDLLVEAFAREAGADPRLHLVLAGPVEAALRERLARQAAQLGLVQRISWAGMLSGDLKWGAYHAAEVFCLPSHQENFGVAVAEALGCGVPVLISDKVNIWREIVADGAGLAGPDTAAGTGACLRQWLQADPAAQAHMRAQARHCFLRRFEVRQSAQRLLEILGERPAAVAPAAPAPQPARASAATSATPRGTP
ncbi:glycosyltransferase [Cupriavidus necator]|uniref:glycosyltransferase n=1 Tax=Cupriavidus necator TaxID=106590 RepID=UPI00277EAD67|nr:glycosyltransferase [Cupriavidus necator]MDQ0143534.1 glycosyltransferase involved in cell wall biosynthesis [Cupriavidus necator]